MTSILTGYTLPNNIDTTNHLQATKKHKTNVRF